MRKLIIIVGLALLFTSAVILGREVITDKSAGDFNPRELMAVTIDRSVLGDDGDPDAIKELLEIGQVIIIDRHTEGVPWLTSAGVLIDAPADKAYQAVTDFDSFPEYVPQTEGSEIKKIGPDLYDVEFDVVVRIVYIPIKADFSLYQYNRPPYRTDWASKTPETAENYGYWELTPVDGGARTIGFYTIYTKAKQGFINRIFSLEPQLEMLACMSTGMLVTRATRDRVESIYRESGGAPSPSRSPKSQDLLVVMKRNSGSVARLASRGRILILEENDTVWSTVGLVLDRPPDEVWEWLVNVEDQAAIDPRVNARVIERDESSMVVQYNLEVYLVLSFELEYQFQYQLEKPHRITWDTIPEKSDIRGTRGLWDLLPVDGGKKTLALCRTTVDFESMGLIMRALLKIEPTFELALQASQNLVGVDNIEKAMTMSPEERKKHFEDRKRAAEESKELPLPEKTDLKESP
jgi:ribosome-associated toxin RatA of RatAB toxin-antitoxin module